MKNKAHNHKWTAAEAAKLRELYPNHKNVAIAKMLGVNINVLAYKIKLMGLKRYSKVNKDAKLRELYPNHKNAEIAKMFGVKNTSAITNKAKALGLRKAPEYKARRREARIGRLYSNDKIIACWLTGSGRNKEMIEEALKHKDIIALKRSLLLLNRAIKEAKQKKQKAA
ncbi:MAG: hypothetical protein LBF67_04685 [Prevotellaceae bacterium]|jgi:hypothetical protein|nr:hypothetical protein [Prevotellaceae bacterium]